MELVATLVGIPWGMLRALLALLGLLNRLKIHSRISHYDPLQVSTTQGEGAAGTGGSVLMVPIAPNTLQHRRWVGYMPTLSGPWQLPEPTTRPQSSPNFKNASHSVPKALLTDIIFLSAHIQRFSCSPPGETRHRWIQAYQFMEVILILCACWYYCICV